MKIVSMRLTNFRQYSGQNIINFSVDNKKPLTLFHGENGAGKSAILNSITWCLYDTTTLKDADQMINKDILLSDASSPCKVEIYFDHGGNRYRAHRSMTSSKTSEMGLSLKDEDGNYKPFSNPKQILNSILPHDIHSYYLFSGESESLTDTTSGGEKIKKSIGTILGMDAAKEAISYIEILRKDVEGKISKNAETSTQLKALQKEIDMQDAFIQTQLDILNNKRSIKAAKESEINQITEDTKDIPDIDINDLQDDIKDLTGDLNKIKGEIITLREEEIKAVQATGWKVLGKNIFESVADLLEKSTEAGEIPGNYKKEIVQKSIDDKCCMLCKTKAGPKEIKELRKALNELVQSESVDRALNLKGDLKVFLEGRSNFTRDIQNISKRETLLAKDEVQTNASLEEKKRLLRLIDNKDLQDLLKKQKKLEQECKTLGNEIYTQEIDINDSQNALKTVKKKYNDEKNKQTGISKTLQKLHDKRDFLISAVDYGNQLIQEAEEEAVIKIQETVNEILSICFRKTVKASINDDFSVTLTDINDNPVVGESKGEGKFLNFAFTLALSSLSRDRADLENDYFVSGANAPFFVDAPFDALGEGYQESVARYMTTLSDQVGIFALPDDSIPIRSSIKEKIGKEYVISYLSPEKKRKESTVSDSLKINGKKYATISYEADFEHSAIIEVK